MHILVSRGRRGERGGKGEGNSVTRETPFTPKDEQTVEIISYLNTSFQYSCTKETRLQGIFRRWHTDCTCS